MMFRTPDRRSDSITQTTGKQAQLPAIRLTTAVGAASLGATAGIRHPGLPPLVRLVGGSVAAVGTAVLAAWLAPTWTLGEYRIWTRDVLRAFPGGSAAAIGAPSLEMNAGRIRS